MNNNSQNNGAIEECEDLCKCGANLRLHTHLFTNMKNPVVKYYVDCPKCFHASEWHTSVDDAIDEFDRTYEQNTSVSDSLCI